MRLIIALALIASTFTGLHAKGIPQKTIDSLGDITQVKRNPHNLKFDLISKNSSDSNRPKLYQFHAGEIDKTEKYHLLTINELFQISSQIELVVKDGKAYMGDQPLHGCMFDLDGFTKGEPCWMVLMSEDASTFIARRAVPFPIQNCAGGAKVSAVQFMPDGLFYRIEGEGFEPDEWVSISSLFKQGDKTACFEEYAFADKDGKFTKPLFVAVCGFERGIVETEIQRFDGQQQPKISFPFGLDGQEKIWIDPQHTSPTGKPEQMPTVKKAFSYAQRSIPIPTPAVYNPCDIQFDVQPDFDKNQLHIKLDNLNKGETYFLMGFDLDEEIWFKRLGLATSSNTLIDLENGTSFPQTITYPANNIREGEPIILELLTQNEETAYPKVFTPKPIKTNNSDGCEIEIAMVDPHGYYFDFKGAGFEPGEEIFFEYTSAAYPDTRVLGLPAITTPDGECFRMFGTGEAYKIAENGTFNLTVLRKNHAPIKIEFPYGPQTRGEKCSKEKREIAMCKRMFPGAFTPQAHK